MLHAMTMWTADLVHHMAYLAPKPKGNIPDPGQGEAPPFAEKFTTLLKWGVWGALFCGVAGFIIIGARMAIQHKKGEGGNHVGSMVIVGFGCLLIVSAYTIVSNLAGS